MARQHGAITSNDNINNNKNAIRTGLGGGGRARARAAGGPVSVREGAGRAAGHGGRARGQVRAAGRVRCASPPTRVREPPGNRALQTEPRTNAAALLDSRHDLLRAGRARAGGVEGGAEVAVHLDGGQRGRAVNLSGNALSVHGSRRTGDAEAGSALRNHLHGRAAAAVDLDVLVLSAGIHGNNGDEQKKGLSRPTRVRLQHAAIRSMRPSLPHANPRSIGLSGQSAPARQPGEMIIVGNKTGRPQLQATGTKSHHGKVAHAKRTHISEQFFN